MNPVRKRRGRRHMGDLAGLVRRSAMPRRIIERRIHQYDIDTVGRQARRGKRLGGRRDVKQDDIGRNSVRDGVALRQTRQRFIDLDQHKFDSRHAFGERQTGGADAGAEINHPIARTCRRRSRQQHGVMTGTVTQSGLPQP